MNIIKYKLTDYNSATCTGEDAGVALQQCQLARPTGRRFSHSLEYLSKPSSSDECNVYTADSFLNRNTDTIQKEFHAKFAVQLLHLVKSASSQAGEGTLWLEVTSTGCAYS